MLGTTLKTSDRFLKDAKNQLYNSFAEDVGNQSYLREMLDFNYLHAKFRSNRFNGWSKKP